MADAAEIIANALTERATIEAKRYDKEYPERVVHDATIGTAKPRTLTPQEQEAQIGGPGWLGPRELKAVEREFKKQKRRRP